MSDNEGMLQGHRIKLLREEKQLTQEELGALVGTSGKQIIRWEKEHTNSKSTVASALAKALGTTADYLLGLTDDPLPPVTGLSSRENRILNQYRKGQYGALVDEIIDEAAKNKTRNPMPPGSKAAFNN